MRILAATGNKNKLEEIRRVLEPLGVSVVSPGDLDIDLSVEETGATFAENAFLKAKAYFRASGLPSLADDSGLCVDALEGRPGIHSATYCGAGSTYGQRISALLKELEEVPSGRQRTARFVSAICCVMDEETILRCEGVCEGRVGFEAAGYGGFGYDPVFYVGDRSFAQLSGDEKDAISHRGNALRAFVALLEEQL